MPIYEFKCPKCTKVEDRKSPIDTIPKLNPVCRNCGVHMERVWSSVGVVWKCSRPTPYSKTDKDKKMSDVPDD